MRKISIGIVLLFATFMHISAQDDSEWFLNKPIEKITFKGLDSVAANDLEGVIKPYINKEYSDVLFWDLQSKLYALDYFEQIIPKAYPAKPDRSAVHIEFEVVERPSIRSIEFIGNSKIRRGDLLETILLKEGDMVTKSKLQIDEAAIRDKYLEKGFPDIRVSAESSTAADNKGVAVVFTIYEGEQTTIKEVRFSGNSFASANTLKGLLTSKEQSLFNSGVYKESNIAEDRERIREYYTSKGFVDAVVTEVKTDVLSNEKDGRKYLALTYYLIEGKQYTFGGITFTGNTIFSEAQLRERIRLTPGKLMNLHQLGTDLLKIADLYYENGYIFNSFKDKAERNESDNTIRYTLMIEERDRGHIENIIIKGNKKTKDEVILREIPLEPGDIFSKKKVTEAWMNLVNLQYFSSVMPEPVYGSAEGLMDLIINVEEQNTADIQFGLTFSGNKDFPIDAYIKLTDKNFMGRGQTMGGSITASPAQQALNFSFEENWLFGQRISAGANFSISHKTVSNVLQDVKGPRFASGDPNAVPDPYDGHYVFSNDQTYNGVQYHAGQRFPGTPTPAEIDEYDLVTDYEYANAKVPSEYLMSYDSFDFSLGGNIGYEYKLPLGSLISSAGLSTTLSYIDYDKNFYRPFSEEIRNNLQKWMFINKFSLTLAWDARDIRHNPQKGFLLSQRLVYTGGILGGSRQYIRTVSKAEGYLKLFDLSVTDSWNFKSVLAAHSAISFVLPQFGRTEPVTTDDDLLRIDGMSTARGWSLNTRGEALWDNWIELRFPISEQLLWFDIFFDAAAIWEKSSGIQAIGLDDFYFGVGANLRITMPNFPIRFGFAKLFRFNESGQFMPDAGPIWEDVLGLRFVVSLSTSLF